MYTFFVTAQMVFICYMYMSKNIHTKFEACSYHSFNDMRDQYQYFPKWAHFSDTVTYAMHVHMCKS